MAQNANDFLVDHLNHHSDTIFTGPKDPDAKFLMDLGFVPGMAKSAAWRLLRKTVISPRFHWKFFRARLRSSTKTASRRRKAFTLMMLAALASLAVLTPWWMFVLAVALPVGPLYNISGLLQFLSEHRWLHESASRLDHEQYKAACWGRFCGDPLPANDCRGWRAGIAWTKWWVRCLGLHLPVRLAVLVGDLPAHDWHHLLRLAGSSPTDWVQGNHARQASIDNGDPAGLSHREIWGIETMIDTVFTGLSQSKLA